MTSVSGSLGDLDRAWLQDFNETVMSDSRGTGPRSGAGGLNGWPSTIKILHPTNETIWTSSQVGVDMAGLKDAWSPVHG